MQVSGVLQQIAEAYGTSLVEGVLSHQLKQFVIDGNKCVLNKPTPEHRAEDGEFEENEVYGIDILVSAAPATISCLESSDTISLETANRQHYYLQASQSCCMSANVLAETIAPASSQECPALHMPGSPCCIKEFRQRIVSLG